MKKTFAALLTLLLCLTLAIAFAESQGDLFIQLDTGKATVNETQTDGQTVREIILFKGSNIKMTPTLMYADEEKQLEAQNAGTAPNKSAKYKWETSDAAIVTVAAGTITAKGSGTAVVTCTADTKDGAQASETVRVTVLTAVKQLTASAKSIKVFAGETAEPAEIKITPEDASCLDLIWSSADEAIATVDASGAVTGIAPGKTTITVTSAEETAAPKKTAIAVTVSRKAEEIRLSAAEGEVAKGKTLKLTAIVLPDDTTDKKITWSSSDPAVAAVAGGVVTGKAAGTAVITATAADGSTCSAECRVEVFEPVTSVTFEEKTASLFVGGESAQLKVTVLPDTAKYPAVTFTSSDEAVVRVDEDGVITPVSGGKATITAVSDDKVGEKGKAKSAVCTVTVSEAVTGLSITGGDRTIPKGKSEKLEVKVSPSTATNQKLEWSTSDPKVASVTGGTVSAKGTGTATITATAADGSGVTASVKVTVIQGVTSVKAEKSKVAVTKGKTLKLTASVLPADATNKKLKWTSDNSSIAKVDSETGVITGQSVGKCTVTATTTDGTERSTKVLVYVEPVIPLDALTFTRSGYFGYYYEFAVTFKNLTQTRTIKYISFEVEYKYAGSTYRYSCYTDSDTISPKKKKKVGWWDGIGYKLSYCSNFKVYLKSVRYSDGTWESFNNELIGWFN